MAKKDNAAAQAAQQAAAQQAPANGAPKVEMPNVNPNTKGLTQGEKVAYLGAIQTERAFMMNNMEKPWLPRWAYPCASLKHFLLPLRNS